jgi:hypothetical protein
MPNSGAKRLRNEKNRRWIRAVQTKTTMDTHESHDRLNFLCDSEVRHLVGYSETTVAKGTRTCVKQWLLFGLHSLRYATGNDFEDLTFIRAPSRATRIIAIDTCPLLGGPWLLGCIAALSTGYSLYCAILLTSIQNVTPCRLVHWRFRMAYP